MLLSSHGKKGIAMKTKECPHCKTKNPKAAVFCKRCGALFRIEEELDNTVDEKTMNKKNIIALVLCAVLLVAAFLVFKSGSSPKTEKVTEAPTQSTTAASTLPTTAPPTTAVPTTTQPSTTEVLTLPTLPPTTQPTTAKPTTTAAPSESEIQEICDEYNALIESLKYSEYEISVHKTVEIGLEITDFSIPVSTSTLNTFVGRLIPKTDETYTFSGETANENSSIVLADYIPPLNTSADVTADCLKNAVKSSDGTITLTFKEDKSTFADRKTTPPPYVSTATEYLNFETYALGTVAVSKADMTYPETVITVEVDSYGDITKLTIRQPVDLKCTGGVGALSADIGMKLDAHSVFEVTYL